MRLSQYKVFCLLIAMACLMATSAAATEIAFYRQGGVNLNGPSYGWWYGCSPTSAGMMVGYYDRNGYGGKSYANLVPGGVAEASTAYGDEARNALVKDVIASQGHVDDFYGGDSNSGFDNYMKSGDDVVGPHHAFNSLADFMGTSQDSAGNSNGSTTLYYYTDGSKFYAKDAVTYSVQDFDGMYGIAEYLQYAGYGDDPTTSLNYFTAHIFDEGSPLGFTFTEYKAEIDAGRVVMIHVKGHSMFGYGYTDAGEIIFDDTWGGHDKLMAWGGSYADMDQWGVTCFIPTGGSVVVPLPATIYFLGTGLVGLLVWRRRCS